MEDEQPWSPGKLTLEPLPLSRALRCLPSVCILYIIQSLRMPGVFIKPPPRRADSLVTWVAFALTGVPLLYVLL